MHKVNNLKGDLDYGHILLMKGIVYVIGKNQFFTSIYCMLVYPYLLLLLAIKVIIIYLLSNLTVIDKR